MPSWLARIAGAFWSRVRRYAHTKKEDEDVASIDGDGDDALLWSRDIGRHAAGEYSFAVVQANSVLEDHSQVETGRDATFVGVYDGHGGPDAALFVAGKLFDRLIEFARESGGFSEDAVRDAFAATEDDFLEHVRRSLQIKPSIATTGSCCVVGIIWRGTLYVANLGDSRAVMGSVGKSNKIVAEQLSRDHNVNLEEVRQELRSLHPNVPNILVQRFGVWRIKGIIQVSRCIGNAYLKIPEFSVDPYVTCSRLPEEPLGRSVLRADPTVISRVLGPKDRFLILASDGLWEHLSNKKAVEIVHKSPRLGIARRLVREAMQEAARKNKMSYMDLKKVDKGLRRHLHDDITVIVVFINHDLLLQPSALAEELSVRGFVDVVGPSNFTVFRASD